MRLAVVGSRGFEDFDKFVQILDTIQDVTGFDVIVSGGAEGADKMARYYAEVNNIELKEHIPIWETYNEKTKKMDYNRGAGFVRNVEIWNDATYGVAFWDGKSKGTAHSFDIARRQEKVLYIYNYVENKIIVNR